MRRRTIALLFAALFAATSVFGGEVASGHFDIVGVSLEVDTSHLIATGVDIPANVQTIFGGKTNADAPPAPGMTAMAELTGPGIAAPIEVSTKPGWPFALPALHEKGIYTLSNIRLVGSTGEFLQQALPSYTTVTVTDTLTTSVTVRQLSADELRARGITVDARNYDVFEYTFVFAVKDGVPVEIPYQVIVDKRTHEAVVAPKPNEYPLPQLPAVQKPPRFQPPQTIPIILGDDLSGDPLPPAPGGPNVDPVKRKPQIPAAIVIPAGFGVLHQFFAVALQVSNSAPVGSEIRLDSITATLDAPLALRVAQTTPAVSFGQPVPVYAGDGSTFLMAGAQGSADWSLEALKAGTHTVDINIRATYKAPGQADVALHGHVSSSIVVSDPRFQVNFSHPDTVRNGETYTAYAFVTNLSDNTQHVQLSLDGIFPCPTYSNFVCRADAGAAIPESDIAPGSTWSVPFKLKSSLTGHIYAAAAQPVDGNHGAGVSLSMGVSASGIPLSPATLVLPYYAQFLDPAFIDANMGLLGLGYSLATAPLNKTTAKFPRVIRNDVFQRGGDIARAGQRIFIARKNLAQSDPAENRAPLFNLALDLLDNVERVDKLAVTPELAEWDELRREEESGRTAAAAMATQLRSTGETSHAQLADDFAAATAHRSPYLFALAHGASLNAGDLSITSTSGALQVPAEAESGWVRTLPYAELTKLDLGGEHGALAMIGRWRESVTLHVKSACTLELIYPDATDGHFLRATVTVSGPTDIVVDRGSRSIGNAHDVAAPQLAIVAAAQDLHLDDAGHVVTLLLNRPVKSLDHLEDVFSLTTSVAKVNYTITRKNDRANQKIFIPGAALQDDGRIITISFDKALSVNATYSIGLSGVHDALDNSALTGATVVPRIDNTRAGGAVYGRVLWADNSILTDVPVQLTAGTPQYDTTNDKGEFLFEFVPRDIDLGIQGNYTLAATAREKYTELKGTVRVVGDVQTVNLVFLGRGTAQGTVTFSDGRPLADTSVIVTSTMFNEFRRGTTDASGHYSVGDLPVGPLTFLVTDPSGRVTYAANQIRTPGEVLTQDLVIQLKDNPGKGTVRVTVRRSDISDPSKALVAGAHVGVYTRGYGLTDGYTDASGQFTFTDVPAGQISILAAQFDITRESVGVELDLKPDTTIDQALLLNVPTPASEAQSVTITGLIDKDDPTAPGITSRNTPVANGLVAINGLGSVTTDANGAYTFTGVPTSYGGVKYLEVFDPASGRRGWFKLPNLVAGQENRVSVTLQSNVVQGSATMRVRVYGPKGEPVSGYHVISPNFPPIEFVETPSGSGIYELPNRSVPQQLEVWAVPTSSGGPYGEQFAKGFVRVDFNGQIGVTELHLPGQGTVLGHIRIHGADCTDCYSSVHGPMAVSYRAWSDIEQDLITVDRVVQPDANDVVTFQNIPAGQTLGIETVDLGVGYASGSTYLSYDGDVKPITLTLDSLASASGRVVLADGQTPVAGATVHFYGSNTRRDTATKADGTFLFDALSKGQGFRIVAEVNQDGIYREGYVDGSTPAGGGPVRNLVVFMREQTTIEGRIVDSSGNPVARAQYWVRELAWPYREFGNAGAPLQAGDNGHFLVGNIFTGPFRITARSPIVQEMRADYQASTDKESDVTQRDIVMTLSSVGGGTGSISVKIINPDTFDPVENAEVSLTRNGVGYDFGSTDAQGVTYFNDVPISGTYRVFAYSKALGRGGSSGNFGVALGQLVDVKIVLQFRGTVRGTVVDPDNGNLPVKGQPVTLTSGGWQTRTSTGALGEFTFIGIPEGPYSLEAYDTDSGRRGYRYGLTMLASDPNQVINDPITLERTATLHVRVYLPNDTGGFGDPAPAADVFVTQVNYSRQLQQIDGVALSFPKMFAGTTYQVYAREIGGEQRETGKVYGNFNGALDGTVGLVFPTSGSATATIKDINGAPVSDARVTISGPNKTVVYYSATDGTVPLTSGFALGWINISASKGQLAASAGAQLTSHSVPVSLPLTLGSYAGIAGFVEAEEGAGQPSVGTRVVIDARGSGIIGGSLHLETRTGSDGRYQFEAIPLGGTTITLYYLGPDDITIGATQARGLANTTTGVVELNPVKLDATPPRVLSIDPLNNANDVAPNSPVTVVFSEQVPSQFLNTDWFQLIATDDGSRVNASVVSSIGANGTYIVQVVPVQPPSGFPLKSNTIYRFVIPQGITDAHGNAMKNAVGSSFTTVDYTEPAVVQITPDTNTPIPEDVTFRIRYNKSIDAASFRSGGSGVVRLEQLDANRQHVADVPLSYYVDPSDTKYVNAAPVGVKVLESTLYKLTVSGAVSSGANPQSQTTPAVFNYVSFDKTPPVLAIIAPDPAMQLVAALPYTAKLSITDFGTTRNSVDIASVDWYDANDVRLAHYTAPPFDYPNFVAPAGTTTFTLKASAKDVSGNISNLAVTTWNVIADQPPANVTVSSTPSSLYAGHHVVTTVTFTDDGFSATVSFTLTGKHKDGSDYRVLQSSELRRTSLTAAWSPATFAYDVPADITAGTLAIAVDVTDATHQTTHAASTLTITADANAPSIVSVAPKTETHYTYTGDPTKDKFTITLKAADAEVAVKRAVIVHDGKTDTLTPSAPDANGVVTFTDVVTFGPHNADTRSTISITVYDYADNAAASSLDVIYDAVNDSDIPKGAWISPLDGAALPKNDAWTTTFRVWATDNLAVTSVTFNSTALAAPITVNPTQGSIYFTTAATLKLQDTPVVVTATISDGTPSHDVVLPITITPVVVDKSVETGNLSIGDDNKDQFANKTVMVRGAGTKLYLATPLALTNLLVLDGGTVTSLDRVHGDLTITDHLFVDSTSSIDYTGKGYLGGWSSREGNSFTNSNSSGQTLGERTDIGASTGSSASHAGLGGEDPLADTNATYGSITNPTDFGSGGSGAPANQAHVAGTNGGGAIALRSAPNGLGVFVVAGAIHADAPSAANGPWGAGAGGSVLIDAHALITASATRISANGGDEDGLDGVSRGGGGGRIAVTVRDRFDYDKTIPLFLAHGGHHNGTENTVRVEAGAGTIYLRKPADTLGTLTVSAYDDRFPTSIHPVRGTPLAGPFNFDAIVIGPRALARFDDAVDAALLTVDPTAKVLQPVDTPAIAITSTTPAADASLIQNTSLSVKYDATAAGGDTIERTRFFFAPTLVYNADNSGTNPASISARAVSLPVAATAGTGPATLAARVVTRSGRTFDTPQLAYTIVANTAPVITTFNVTPDSMYAGHSIAVNAAATDDIAVQSFALTSSTGSVSSTPATNDPVTHTLSQSFSVAIPATTASGTTVTLNLSATDGFPGRAAVTAPAKTVTILHDPNPPAFGTITPADGTIVQEATGATFHVSATATDAEVAVKDVKATFNGATVTMPLSSGTYNADFAVPSVDGVDNVAFPLTITATDYDGNATTVTRTINVKPLVDPLGATMSWICSSPNAMYPAGYAVPLKLSAIPSSGSNGVSTVKVSINGGAQVAATSLGSNLYEYDYTIPSGTAADTTFTAVVTATSVGNNVSTLTTTFTSVPSAGVITTVATIAATDTLLDNTTLVIGSGGNVTITGAHTYKNLVVLNGGTLVQKAVDRTRADQITADRLYIACGATVDVRGLGYPRIQSYPGAGTPANASGGGHIGRGGLWDHFVGMPFGSVYRPLEAGGGGNGQNDGDKNQGGGAVRIDAASSVAVDGSIVADSASTTGWVPGAGGSVWLSTRGPLSGNGSISAAGYGSTNLTSGGGGGAIALEYATASGNVLNNLNAAGGQATALGLTGSAGSIYLKSGASTYGEITFDNKSTPNRGNYSELPAFGTATVASVSGTAVTLDRKWLAPSLAGNWVQVIAPNGTVKSTSRIAGVTNGPSFRSMTGFIQLYTTDSAAYDGYLIESDTGYTVAGATRRLIAARYSNGQWQFDNDTTFVTFTPNATDRVFASFSKTASGITTVNKLTCGGSGCGSVNGVPVVEMAGGEIDPNTALSGITCLVADASELVMRPEFASRSGIVFSGEPAQVTFEGTVDVQPGDRLRGIYRFDKLTLKNTSFFTADLIELGQAVVKDSGSSYTTGNTAAPVIDVSKITVVAGANGPLLTGAAGAVSDADGPVEVTLHDATRGAIPPRMFPMQNEGWVQYSTDGGFSMYRWANGGHTGTAWDTGASAVSPITNQGYISFKVTSPGQPALIGFSAGDTTVSYTEPGIDGFNPVAGNSTWSIWSNGTDTGTPTGTFTTNTQFRIEKTLAYVRWLVDGKEVFRRTTNVPPTVRLDVAFANFNGNINMINSVVYDTVSSVPTIVRVNAASDGSFSIPIDGSVGDALSLIARDGHTYSLESAEVSVGTITAAQGVASLVLNPGTIIGGHTTTGTVTLGMAAGTGGATVTLTSDNAAATLPATVTIPQGQTSATFTISAVAVAADTVANIRATWGAAGVTSPLTITKDTAPPSITITAPAANAPFTEGKTIALSATITDADSGVASAFATIDGVNTTLTKNGSTWSGNATAPFVDGTQPVTKQLTITSADNTGNSGTSSVSIVVNPVVENTSPTVAWSCLSSGAIYPASYSTKIRMIARAPNATNTLQSVELLVVDGSGATISRVTATLVATDTYEATLAVPDAADGTVYTARALATTVAGTTATTDATFTVAKTNVVIISSTIGLASNDTSYDNKSLFITGGTFTIAGAHHFTRFAVLESAVVTHPNNSGSLQMVNVSADAIYVSCSAAIDASLNGYPPNVTYPGAAIATGSAGGSHLGYGHTYSGDSAGSVYGSVYFPQEPGAGAGYCAWGGGVVRLSTTALTVDGAIRANGAGYCDRDGAGGSVWITTSTIGGNGSIEARAVDTNDPWNWGGAGGGAIAIEYSGSASGTLLNNLNARAGAKNSNRSGGPGTVYVKGPSSTYGDLTIDSKNINNTSTELPSLGKGIAQTGTGGTTLVTDRSANIPNYFVGHWIEITAPDGTLRGTWRVTAVNNKTVTLAPNGAGDTVTVQAGDGWQGVYRFDNLSVPWANYVGSGDPIRLGGAAGVTVTGPANGNWLDMSNTPFTSTQPVTIAGGVLMASLSAPSLHVVSGGTLNGGLRNAPMVITSPTVTIDAGGAIDVTGRGYDPNVTYPGAAIATGSAGGSHLGYGHTYSGDTAGSVYGSLYFPQEAGAGAGYCAWGGGILRLVTTNLTVNGAIRANGASYCDRSGAGGSVWVTTSNIGGSGTIEARGADTNDPWNWGGGGGGAIAIEYSGSASGTVLSNLNARPGAKNSNRSGGPGSVYVKSPSSTYGDLTIDSKNVNNTSTELPSLGKGTAQTGTGGTTLVTDRSANIPSYFVGHWIEITAPDGTLRGTWRVTAVNNKTVTLAPNGSGDTVTVQTGDGWQGVYRFDNMTAPWGDYVGSADPIRLGGTAAVTITGPTNGGMLDMSNIPVTSTQPVTIAGGVLVASLNAPSLHILNGGTLSGGLRNVPLVITSPAVTVDGGGAIDVSTRGYDPNVTYPGQQGATGSAGGSHIGYGHVYSGDTAGWTYGSVYFPQEAGAGAGYCSWGGGIVRLITTNLTVDGAIRANGAGYCDRSGAGGSIWVTTSTIGGSGAIEARGADTNDPWNWGGGGGGAIAIEYSGSASGTLLSNLNARGGAKNSNRGGAPGSIVVKGPASAYGALTVDAKNTNPGLATELPPLGHGTAQSGTSGNTLVADVTSNIKGFFVGHYVEITAPDKTLKGTWRIATIVNNTTVTLAPNHGETINVQPGDGWQGVYHFDSQTVINGGVLVSNDPIRLGTAPLVTAAQPAATATGNQQPATEARNAGKPEKQPDKPATPSAVLASLILAPESLTGGGLLNGTVTLDHPAPEGGAVVVLTSSSASVSVPENVTIPAGETSAAFSIITTPVADKTTVTITATYAATQSALVTLNANQESK